MALQKLWNVKVYSPDGTTLQKTIPTANLGQNPSFRSRINGGQGECVLKLVGAGFKFDSFGEGTTIKHMAVIEIWCTDANNPLGRRIYKGFISRYAPFVDADGTEGVEVTALGLLSLLSRSFY